jgi:hypothetical protein
MAYSLIHWGMAASSATILALTLGTSPSVSLRTAFAGGFLFYRSGVLFHSKIKDVVVFNVFACQACLVDGHDICTAHAVI